MPHFFTTADEVLRKNLFLVLNQLAKLLVFSPLKIQVHLASVIQTLTLFVLSLVALLGIFWRESLSFSKSWYTLRALYPMVDTHLWSGLVTPSSQGTGRLWEVFLDALDDGLDVAQPLVDIVVPFHT